MNSDVKSGATQAWRPSSTLPTLKQRADFFAAIRTFFHQYPALEVDTPILGKASVTDPHIESMRLSDSPGGRGHGGYLQTSPEFAMKRLLSAGSGDIYQIARVFRQGEVGRLHNPEFTMLEWYRVGYDHHQLMAEVEVFLKHLGFAADVDKMTYAEAFSLHTGLEIHEVSEARLKAYACDLGVGNDLLEQLTERDQCLDLIMSQAVGSRLGIERPVFVYDFPASQAALARLGDHGLAERFELFIQGIEVANGYHELTDAQELLARFNADNAMRERLGLRAVDIDRDLLAAMHSGLPACAGVAVGLDRLLMKMLNHDSLAEVMPFAYR